MLVKCVVQWNNAFNYVATNVSSLITGKALWLGDNSDTILHSNNFAN